MGRTTIPFAHAPSGRRSSFMQQSLGVSAYRREQRYLAGEYINSDGGGRRRIFRPGRESAAA
jgi:Cu2+-containing amine oxidase